MREALALVRASWLTATSYRLAMLLSLASLLVMVVPVFFIADALQPVMADAIRTQGEHYFAFLLVGMVAFAFLGTAVSALPGAIAGGIGTGTLEALLSTRAPLHSLLAGLVGYSFIWTAIRSTLLLTAGVLLGAQLAATRVPAAAAILFLIVLSYLPFGIIAAAMVLAFRTTGPLPQAVLVVSGLLGGVYYPTHVIPSWIQEVSRAVPLTYGLRALRRTLLEGVPMSGVASDLGILLLFVALLATASVLLFGWALRHARRAGTLAQY